ncbi:Linear gramicidin synthase subunit D [Pseudoalteromonas sp. CIP111854]|uniref:Linear gramicidin synthase subunit D n=1 Tax=Pseudoalteromonas holothuriae TaxID=2963714 RepID=A0A9W4W0E8_9GAMM|nr:Linear gramicidin synthase subunit D [Pseudoalteromonas sp. CIP111854]
MWSMVSEVTPSSVQAGSILLANSLHNYQHYILDTHQQLLPVGSIGELYIGGAALARGYLNRPVLTEERFIAHPFASEYKMAEDARLYRTGDLVRYLPDGSMEFIGRVDEQVKVRGYRIELGEVEAQLSEIESIVSAVVQVSDKQTHLVGYVMADKEVEDENEWLRVIKSSLQESLPDYMVPSAFVVMRQWPLTPNGKIDRKALAGADVAIMQSQYVAPKTALEETLVEIFAELLNLESDKISTTANFFELGGHSLLAVRLISAICQRFELDVSIKEIFQVNNLADLSAFIERQLNYREALLEDDMAESGKEILI